MNLLEREIEKLEQRSAELDILIEENASDYIRLGELQAEKDELQLKIDQMYQEWSELG